MIRMRLFCLHSLALAICAKFRDIRLLISLRKANAVMKAVLVVVVAVEVESTKVEEN
jgi:hypothetical protein